MAKVVVKNAVATRIDWLAAKKEYLADATMTHKRIAEKYGVNEHTVQVRARKESWGKQRESIGQEANQRAMTQIVDELAEINKRHTNTFRNMQALEMKLLDNAIKYIDHMVAQAKTENRILSPKELLSMQQAKFLAEGIRNSIEGERITYGLPISVTKTENEVHMVDDFGKFSDEQLKAILNDDFDPDNS